MNDKNNNSNTSDDKKLIEEIKEKIIRKYKKCNNNKIKEKENINIENQSIEPYSKKQMIY